MRMTVPWRWWYVAMGFVIAAGLISRDRGGGIAAAIVVAGMLAWSFWPVLHAKLCVKKLAQAFEREDAADARRWLERLDYLRDKNAAWLRINEAAILSMEEKYGEARRVLATVDTRKPQWLLLRENALAWCEAHDGAAEAACERAEKTLAAARAQYPAIVAYCLGTLGAARAIAGRSDAIDPLQEALRSGRPPRAQAIRAYYLGEAYRAAGRTDDAIAAYERARREMLAGRWVQKAADRLQELAQASPYR